MHICKICSTFAAALFARIPILLQPRWIAKYAICVYILALAGVSLMYFSHSLPWYYMLSGMMSVLIFFLYGQRLTTDLSVLKVRKNENFEKRLFLLAFIPRMLVVLLLYWIFQSTYGNPFGFEDADATTYHDLASFVADLIHKKDFHFFSRVAEWSGNDDISDMGYGIYLGLVYWMTGKSILAARLLKCLWSTLTVVLVYRLARRDFGEQIARLAAIFCALWPNFWYYCSAHLKEVEMVFLTVLFVEQADQMLRSKKFTALKIIPVLLIAAVLFTFRTPLGLVALIALLFSLVMSSSKIVSWGKRIIIGILAVSLIGVAAGERLEQRFTNLVEQVQRGDQKSSLRWRSQREQGNEFAKYAGSAVFAPMIFTLPFPTMANPSNGQEVQLLNNGGNFIKNILSCFTILALVLSLLTGRWRDHLLPLSFMLGYLVVLTLSNFAHSERFHQPVMPFEFMFMAYGVSIATTKKKYKRWFTYWCLLMFLAAILWNIFKMKGRGI